MMSFKLRPIVAKTGNAKPASPPGGFYFWFPFFSPEQVLTRTG
jgi:hypothetical protein